MSNILKKEAIEEYEKIIQSLSKFEASLIEIQEMLKKDKDTLTYRKYVISKAVSMAKDLNIELTVFLIACELVLGNGEY
jgi:hypothetical protein